MKSLFSVLALDCTRTFSLSTNIKHLSRFKFQKCSATSSATENRSIVYVKSSVGSDY